MPDRNVSRHGDYLVTDDARDEAQDAFEERSKRSRARDKATRAPIESDVDVWKRNQRVLDFPGVDTPDAAPRQRMLDFPLGTERKRAGGKDVRLMPDPERDDPEVGDELDEILQPFDNLLDL